MFKPLWRCYVFVVVVVLTVANIPELAVAEPLGTSAVPYYSAPPPPKPRTPAQNNGVTPFRPATYHATWSSSYFPPPNGGLLVFTIMPDGNPACASYDGSGCLWGLSYNEINFNQLRPLVCGEDHRSKWGVTGYENPNHWCNLARRR
jgi:hypothetical protein